MPVLIPMEPEDHVIVDEDFAQVLARHWRRGWSIRREPQGLRRPALIIPNGMRWKDRVRIARLVTHAPPNRFPQHLNGDVLDCRRANLRLVVSRGEAGSVPST
ncbi:MAG TPA: hypothetical protein VF194_07250 [Ferrovibrio sp.]|uniref:hypothetical protein n=1 Tax=Ferrovibrio sp. TaxID=1917215 RepID=UPI002ED58621